MNMLATIIILCSQLSWLIEADKSFQEQAPEVQYASAHSFKLSQEQMDLMNETLQMDEGVMLGAPEVMRINEILMKSINAKNVIDVGLFTGMSAISAAITIPDDGKVVAMDVSPEYWQEHGKKYAEKLNLTHKIDVQFYPENAGIIVLDKLIAQNGTNSFDFCFIDANKDQYLDYYKKCKDLVRSGGIIAIDNVIWGMSGHVAIHELNEYISRDVNVTATMLTIAQGLTIVYLD